MPKKTDAFTRPRGTRDFLPQEMAKRRFVEEAMRGVFEDFGYGEIETPIFENLELITAKSGEEIKRHLYHFKDKGDRDLTLRPELTAPAMRLFLQELTHSPKPVKLYYFGDCFRYEEPQSGRYREFRQAGVELIGSPHPEAESEVIAVAVTALQKLGLKDFHVGVGEVGVLRGLLKAGGIDENEQSTVMIAIDKGGDVKAILDDFGMEKGMRDLLLEVLKLKGGNEALKMAFELTEKMGVEETKNRLERLKKTLGILESMGIVYSLDLGIARGLDYYSGMVFEIYAEGLGAQRQICGGGTYSLTEIFGGEPAPTCGFAFGFDRVILALDARGQIPPRLNTRYLVVPTEESVIGEAMRIASLIRRKTGCEVDLMRRKLAKALTYANSKGSQQVIIVGEDELSRGRVVLKDMEKGTQKEIKIDELSSLL